MLKENQPTNDEQVKAVWDQLDAEESGLGAATSPADDAVHELPKAEIEAPVTTDPEISGEKVPVAIDPQQTLLDTVSGLQAQLAQVTGRLRNAEGHIGGIKSTLGTELQKLQAGAKAAGVDAPSKAQIDAATHDADALRTLKDEYPQFGEVMERTLAAQERNLTAKFEALLPTQTDRTTAEARANALEAETARLHMEMRELPIEAAHKGWKSTVQTPAFHGWMERQSREVRLLSKSQDTEDAIRLLDLHAHSMAAQEPKNQDRLRAAAALPSGRSTGVQTKSLDEMSNTDYWKLLDAKDKKAK